MGFFERVLRHSSQPQWGRHILPDAMRGVRRGRLGEPGVPLESVGGYDTDPFVAQDVPGAQTQVNLDDIVQRSDVKMAEKKPVAPQTTSDGMEENLNSWTAAVDDVTLDILECLGLPDASDANEEQEVETAGDIQKGIGVSAARMQRNYRRLKRALAALDEIKISIQGN